MTNNQIESVLYLLLTIGENSQNSSPIRPQLDDARLRIERGRHAHVYRYEV